MRSRRSLLSAPCPPTPRRWPAAATVALATVVLAGACTGSNPPVDATGSTPASTGSAPASTAPPASTTAGTATTQAGPAAPDEPGYPGGKQRITLNVGGTARTAVLAVPERTASPAPLVFAFHGHGGSGANFNRKMDVEELWPEAIVDTANASVDGYLTSAKGPGDIELVTYIHPAGHEVPDAVPPLVVAFFQRHKLPS